MHSSLKMSCRTPLHAHHSDIRTVPNQGCLWRHWWHCLWRFGEKAHVHHLLGKVSLMSQHAVTHQHSTNTQPSAFQDRNYLENAIAGKV